MSARTEIPATGLERADWALIGALTLLAAAIRFYQLGSESLWGDEGITVHRASLGLSGLFDHSIAAHQTPTYFLLMHAWLGLGDSEFLLRAPSAIFGALTVALCYALGRLVGGRRVALVTALLVAVSTFQVYYAQEARPYALLTLSAAVAMLGLVWLVQNPGRAILAPRSWRHLDPAAGLAWIGFALGTLSALATHNMAVFFLLAANAVFALLVLRLREQWSKLLRNWLLAHAVILAVWIWWWPVLFRQGTRVIDHFNYSAPTGGGIVDALLQVGVDGNYGVLSFSLPFWAALGAWTLRRQPWLLAALIGLLVVSPLAILAFSLVQPVFAPRQLIWTTLPFFVLAACGIASIRLKLLFAALLVVILAEGGVKLDRYYEAQTKPDWRRLTKVLLEVVQPGGLVAVNPTFAPEKLIDYYLRRLGAPPGRFELLRVPRESTGDPIVNALQSTRPIWLIIDLRTKQSRTVAATAERAAVLFEVARETTIRIYRLERRE